MKGTPAVPQCGFSRGVVQVLNATNTKFDSYDVIADNELRNEIKASLVGPIFRFRGDSDLLFPKKKTHKKKDFF
jgi:hypothetical protein